jgi:hypothetical protein
MYALKDYGQALSNFVSMCKAISEGLESSSSEEAISTMIKLHMAMRMCANFFFLPSLPNGD